MKRFALFVFLLAPVLHATTYIVPSDREMIAAAPVIVSGTVSDSWCRRAADGSIETVTEVLVGEALKGHVGRTLTLVQWGGHLGDEWAQQSDAPELPRGANVLLFAEKNRDGELTPYGVGLGVFRIEPGHGADMAVRRVAITGWSEDGVEHVERVRMERAFVEYIRSVVAGVDAAPAYFSDDTTSTDAHRKIAANATFTGSGYTFLFGASPARRKDTNLNISWRPIGTQSGLDLEGSIDFGNGKWNNQSPKINYSRGSAATGDTKTFDSEHRVIANDPHGDIAGTFGGSGVVATAFSFGSSTFSFNSESFTELVHSDIVVQDGVSSGNISSTIFNVVMTHELGHTLGLRHSNQAQNGTDPCASPLDCCINTPAGGSCKAIMLSSATSLTGLQNWDKNAIDCLYDAACASDSSCTPPSISTQPANKTIAAGGSTSLSVVAAGTGPFTYQWYIGNSGDTSNPTGSNSSTLSSLSPASTTSYWVRVTGQCPSPADSNTATVTVQPCVNASIGTQPASKSINAGSTTSLSVTAAGSGPFTYQWFVGESGDTSTPIGTNSPTLSSLSPSSTTSYWVRVTGLCGDPVNSNTATITVTVCLTPVFVSATATTGSGGQVTLAASALGGLGMTYTWFQGDTPGFGGTQIGTGTPLVTTITGTTKFWVRARNNCGNSAVSELLTASLCGLPSIVTQPADQTVNSGASATISLELAAPGSTTKWYRGALNDKTTQVATGESFATGPLTVTTTFWAAVANSCGEVASRLVTITIAECAPPSIGTQPAELTTIKAGETVTLSVIATGTAPLTYAWFEGEPGDISKPVGDNTSTFTSARLLRETKFWVRITNACGTATSTSAAVKVPLGRRRSVR